jgi:VanZ family protein
MRILSIYFVMLAFLSLNPWLRPNSGQAVGNIPWDKIDHAAAYCLFSFLLMWIYREYKQRRVVSFIVLLTCPLVGVIFEYCQRWFTSTRQFSYHDAIANVFGTVLGVALFLCYLFVAKRANKYAGSREEKR